MSLVKSYVYVARQRKGHYLKIGRTNNLKRRLGGLGLELLAALEPYDGDVNALERRIHNDLAAHRTETGREWFEPAPEVWAYLKEQFGVDLP